MSFLSSSVAASIQTLRYLTAKKSLQPAFQIQKRNWCQCYHVVATPPRVKVSFAEKMLHGMVMLTVWMTPVCYSLSQLKVWRVKYVES